MKVFTCNLQLEALKGLCQSVAKHIQSFIIPKNSWTRPYWSSL